MKFYRITMHTITNIKSIKLLYCEKLKTEYINEKTIYYWLIKDFLLYSLRYLFHLLKIDARKKKIRPKEYLIIKSLSKSQSWGTKLKDIFKLFNKFQIVACIVCIRFINTIWHKLDTHFAFRVATRHQLKRNRRVMPIKRQYFFNRTRTT